MKKFLIKISYTLLPVWLFFVVFAIYLWVSNDNTGDLMRLALIKSDPGYVDSIRSALLPDVYYKQLNSDSLLRQDTCDVLVFGDSFSHGGGVGKWGDYVNYLAHDGNLKVTVFSYQDNPVQMAYDALNLGIIDSTRVRNLVVEEIERYIDSRHSVFVTTDTCIVQNTTLQVAAKADDDKPPKESYSPLLRVKDYIFYHCFGANPIYDARLSIPAFGGMSPDLLYFYNEDVKLGVNLSSGQRNRIVSNYKRLITLARERGVNLILLIACDKYDLYQDWIVDNPYPAKTLNEDISQWMTPDERQHFIFAKEVLHPLVEQGVKDVYLFNDTHWSPASSRIIAGEVIKKLD